MMLPDLDQIIAHHEAGHCVVAITTGLKLRSVRMAFDDGKADWLVRDNAHDRHMHALTLLAGPRAELRFVGSYSDARLAEKWQTHWRHDLYGVLKHCDGSIAEAITEVDHLVRRHWGAIKRVAAALLEAGQLTGREVEALMAQQA